MLNFRNSNNINEVKRKISQIINNDTNSFKIIQNYKFLKQAKLNDMLRRGDFIFRNAT